jgi:hypothetical protein
MWESAAIWGMTVINNHRAKTTRLIDSVVAAYAGRLHPGLVRQEGLTNALIQLKHQCAVKGRRMAIANAAQLFQLRASFLYDPNINTFHLVTHIPIYRNEYVMQLYKHIPLPLGCSYEMGCSLRLAVELSPKEKFLAVNDGRTLFKSFTPAELDNCDKLGDAYFCESAILNKPSQPDCLVALYRNQPDFIRSRCPAIITAPKSQFFRLNQTHWIVSDPEKLHLTISCDDGTTHSAEIDGITMLSVQQGCTVSSDKWILVRDSFEPTTQVSSHLVDTDITIAMFTPHLTRTDWQQLDKTITSVGTPVEHIAQLDLFKQKVADARVVAQLWRMWHLIATSCTAGLAVTLMMVFGLRRCRTYCVNRWTRGDEVSFPRDAGNPEAVDNHLPVLGEMHVGNGPSHEDPPPNAPPRESPVSARTYYGSARSALAEDKPSIPLRSILSATSDNPPPVTDAIKAVNHPRCGEKESSLPPSNAVFKALNILAESDQ